MRLSLTALVLGFLIDLLIGDPHWLYHPVRLIGKLITALERVLYPWKNKYLAGILLTALVVIVTSGCALALLLAAEAVHPCLRLAVETCFCWQLLAAKSLRDESMKVYDRLREHDLEGSRRAVSMIVGRDTQRLDEKGVAKAAVETVAENASDGVIAPMLYMALGGAALGFFYKAINTMDSMIGYKNDRYLQFGRFAAKLDDAANFIPSRLSALLMTAAAYLIRLDGRGAWKIFRRDRRRHASPNSAQTESVMAGALDVQLAGDAWYFGKLCQKPTIGDDIRPVEAQDIVRANRLLYATALLGLLVMAALKLACIRICGM